MKSCFRFAGVMAFALALASGAQAQQASNVAGGAAAVKALESSMTPGEGQEKLA